MPYGNCGWGMNGGWGMWLFAALLLLGLAVLMVLAVRLLSRPSGPGGHFAAPSSTYPPPPGEGRARQILEERYARGEIDSEEYRERRRVLDGHD